MKKQRVALVGWLVGTILVSPALAVSFNPVTDVSYGVWFDRDGGAGSSQSVSGPSSGLYNIVVTYHAVGSDTATMFATVNGLQQGFYVNGVDFTPAGLSFESSSLAAMEVFWAMHFPKPYGNESYIKDITLSGTRASGSTETTSYTDLQWFHNQNTPIAPPAELLSGSSSLAGHYEEADPWDLTQGDLILSYTADFHLLFGERQYSPGPPEWWGKFFLVHLGLQPDDRLADGFTPDGGGWMGNVVLSGTANPSAWTLMDKFDLQRDGEHDHWIYDVTKSVPDAGSTLLLLSLGLTGLALSSQKFKM